MSKEKERRIVATINAEGDSSVGMFPITLKVTIDGLDMQEDIEDGTLEGEGRKNFREDLRKLFNTYLDYGKVGVSFNDECIECGEILIKKKRGYGYKKHKCPLAQFEVKL